LESEIKKERSMGILVMLSRPKNLGLAGLEDEGGKSGSHQARSGPCRK